MPTLYSALRTHVRGPRSTPRKQTREPRLFAEVAAVPLKRKPKKEEKIYKLSLTDRFKIHRRTRRPTVIVIGAGFAGLVAAHELYSVGYDVTVVEGRKRRMSRN